MKQKKSKKQNGTKVKKGLLFSYSEYRPKEDIYLDELWSGIEIINLTLTAQFPINIEAERAEMDIEPERMTDLVKMMHGADSKGMVINSFKTK